MKWKRMTTTTGNDGLATRSLPPLQSSIMPITSVHGLHVGVIRRIALLLVICSIARDLIDLSSFLPPPPRLPGSTRSIISTTPSHSLLLSFSTTIKKKTCDSKLWRRHHGITGSMRCLYGQQGFLLRLALGAIEGAMAQGTPPLSIAPLQHYFPSSEGHNGSPVDLQRPYSSRRIGVPVPWRSDYPLVDVVEHAFGGLVPPPYWVANEANLTSTIDLGMLYYGGHPVCTSAEKTNIWNPFKNLFESKARLWSCQFSFENRHMGGYIDFSMIPPMVKRIILKSTSAVASDLVFKGLATMPANVHTFAVSGLYTGIQVAMSYGMLGKLIPITVGALGLQSMGNVNVTFTVPATFPPLLQVLSLDGTLDVMVVGAAGLLPLITYFIGTTTSVTVGPSTARTIAVLSSRSASQCDFHPASAATCDAATVAIVMEQLGWKAAQFSPSLDNTTFSFVTPCQGLFFTGLMSSQPRLDLSVLPTTVTQVVIDTAAVVGCQRNFSNFISVVLNIDHLHRGLTDLRVMNSNTSASLPLVGLPPVPSSRTRAASTAIEMERRVFQPALLPSTLKTLQLAVPTDVYIAGPLNLEALPPSVTTLDLSGLPPMSTDTTDQKQYYLIPQTINGNLTLTLPSYAGLRGPPNATGAQPPAYYFLSDEQRTNNAMINIVLRASAFTPNARIVFSCLSPTLTAPFLAVHLNGVVVPNGHAQCPSPGNDCVAGTVSGTVSGSSVTCLSSQLAMAPAAIVTDGVSIRGSALPIYSMDESGGFVLSNLWWDAFPTAFDGSTAAGLQRRQWVAYGCHRNEGIILPDQMVLAYPQGGVAQQRIFLPPGAECTYLRWGTAECRCNTLHQLVCKHAGLGEVIGFQAASPVALPTTVPCGVATVLVEQLPWTSEGLLAPSAKIPAAFFVTGTTVHYVLPPDNNIPPGAGSMLVVDVAAGTAEPVAIRMVTDIGRNRLLVVWLEGSSGTIVLRYQVYTFLAASNTWTEAFITTPELNALQAKTTSPRCWGETELNPSTVPAKGRGNRTALLSSWWLHRQETRFDVTSSGEMAAVGFLTYAGAVCSMLLPTTLIDATFLKTAIPRYLHPTAVPTAVPVPEASIRSIGIPLRNGSFVALIGIGEASTVIMKYTPIVVDVLHTSSETAAVIMPSSSPLVGGIPVAERYGDSPTPANLTSSRFVPRATAASVPPADVVQIALVTVLNAVVSLSASGTRFYVSFPGASSTRTFDVSLLAAGVKCSGLLPLAPFSTVVAIFPGAQIGYVDLLPWPYTVLSPLIMVVPAVNCANGLVVSRAVHVPSKRMLFHAYTNYLKGCVLLRNRIVEGSSGAFATAHDPNVVPQDDPSQQVAYHVPTASFVVSGTTGGTQLSVWSPGCNNATSKLPSTFTQVRIVVPAMLPYLVIFLAAKRDQALGFLPALLAFSDPVRGSSLWYSDQTVLSEMHAVARLGVVSTVEWRSHTYQLMSAARRRLVSSFGASTTQLNQVWLEPAEGALTSSLTLLAADDSTIVTLVSPLSATVESGPSQDDADTTSTIVSVANYPALLTTAAPPEVAALAGVGNNRRGCAPRTFTLCDDRAFVTAFNSTHFAVTCRNNLTFLTALLSDNDVAAPPRTVTFPPLMGDVVSSLAADGPLPLANVGWLSAAVEWFDGGWLLGDQDRLRYFDTLSRSIASPPLVRRIPRAAGNVQQPFKVLRMTDMGALATLRNVGAEMNETAISYASAAYADSTTWSHVGTANYLYEGETFFGSVQKGVAYATIPSVAFCWLNSTMEEFRCIGPRGVGLYGSRPLQFYSLSATMQTMIKEGCSKAIHDMSMSGDVTAYAIHLTCQNTQNKLTAFKFILQLKWMSSASAAVSSFVMLNVSSIVAPYVAAANTVLFHQLASHATGALAIARDSVVTVLPCHGAAWVHADSSWLSVSPLPTMRTLLRDAMLMRSLSPDSPSWSTFAQDFLRSPSPPSINTLFATTPPTGDANSTSYGDDYSARAMPTWRWLSDTLAFTVVPQSDMVIAATNASGGKTALMCFCDTTADATDVANSHAINVTLPAWLAAMTLDDGFALSATYSRLYIGAGYHVYAVDLTTTLRPWCERLTNITVPRLHSAQIDEASISQLTPSPLPGDTVTTTRIRGVLGCDTRQESFVAYGWYDVTSTIRARLYVVDTMMRLASRPVTLHSHHLLIAGISVSPATSDLSFMVCDCDTGFPKTCNVDCDSFVIRDPRPWLQSSLQLSSLEPDIVKAVDPSRTLSNIVSLSAPSSAITVFLAEEFSSRETVTLSAFQTDAYVGIAMYLRSLNWTFGIFYKRAGPSEASNSSATTMGLGTMPPLTKGGQPASALGPDSTWRPTLSFDRIDDVHRGSSGRLFCLGVVAGGRRELFALANIDYLASTERNRQSPPRGVPTGLGSKSSLPPHLRLTTTTGRAPFLLELNFTGSMRRQVRVMRGLTLVLGVNIASLTVLLPAGRSFSTFIVFYEPRAALASNETIGVTVIPDIDGEGQRSEPTLVLLGDDTVLFHSAATLAIRPPTPASTNPTNFTDFGCAQVLVVSASQTPVSGRCFAAVAPTPYRAAHAIAVDSVSNAIRLVNASYPPQWLMDLPIPAGIMSRPSAVAVVRVALTESGGADQGVAAPIEADPLHDCAVIFIAEAPLMNALGTSRQVFKWYRGSVASTGMMGDVIPDGVYAWHDKRAGIAGRGIGGWDFDDVPLGLLYVHIYNASLRNAPKTAGCLLAVDAAFWATSGSLFPSTPVHCGIMTNASTYPGQQKASSLFDSGLLNLTTESALPVDQRRPVKFFATSAATAIDVLPLVSAGAPSYIFHNESMLMIDDSYTLTSMLALEGAQPLPGRLCGEVRGVPFPRTGTTVAKVSNAIGTVTPLLVVLWTSGHVDAVELPISPVGDADGNGVQWSLSVVAPLAVGPDDFVDVRLIKPLNLLLVLRRTCVTVISLSASNAETPLAGHCGVQATSPGGTSGRTQPARFMYFRRLSSFDVLVLNNTKGNGKGGEVKLLMTDVGLGCIFVVAGLAPSTAEAWNISECRPVIQPTSFSSAVFDNTASSDTVARVATLSGNQRRVVVQRNDGSAMLFVDVAPNAWLPDANVGDGLHFDNATLSFSAMGAGDCASPLGIDDMLLKDRFDGEGVRVVRGAAGSESTVLPRVSFDDPLRNVSTVERLYGSAEGAFSIVTQTYGRVCPLLEPLTGSLITINGDGSHLLIYELCRKYDPINGSSPSRWLANPALHDVGSEERASFAQLPNLMISPEDAFVVPWSQSATGQYLISVTATPAGTAWAAVSTQPLIVLVDVGAATPTWSTDASRRLGIANRDVNDAVRDGYWTSLTVSCPDCAEFRRPTAVQPADATCTRLYVLDDGFLRVVIGAHCIVGFNASTFVRTLSPMPSSLSPCQPAIADWITQLVAMTSHPLLDADLPAANATTQSNNGSLGGGHAVLLTSVVYVVTSSGSTAAVVVQWLPGNQGVTASIAPTNLSKTRGRPIFSARDPSIVYLARLTDGAVEVYRLLFGATVGGEKEALPTHALNVSTFLSLGVLSPSLTVAPGSDALTVAARDNKTLADILVTIDAYDSAGVGAGVSMFPVRLPSSPLVASVTLLDTDPQPLMLRQPNDGVSPPGMNVSATNASLPRPTSVALLLRSVPVAPPGMAAGASSSSQDGLLVYLAFDGGRSWMTLTQLPSYVKPWKSMIATDAGTALTTSERKVPHGLWFQTVDDAIHRCVIATTTVTNTTTATNTTTTTATNTSTTTATATGTTTDTATLTTTATSTTSATTTPSSSSPGTMITTTVTTNAVTPGSSCAAPFLATVGFNTDDAAAAAAALADGTLLASVARNASSRLAALTTTTTTPASSASPSDELVGFSSQLPAQLSARSLRRPWNVTVVLLGVRPRRSSSINATEPAWLASGFLGGWGDAFELIPAAGAQAIVNLTRAPRCHPVALKDVVPASGGSGRALVLRFAGDDSVDASQRHQQRCDFDPRMFACPFARESERGSLDDVMASGVASVALDFLPEITPLPAAVEKSMRQVAFSAGTMSFVSGSPAVASQMARANMALSLAQCQFDHEAAVDFANSPLGLRFGDTTAGAYYRGGIVGNTVLWLGLAALHVLAGVVMHLVRKRVAAPAGEAEKTLLGWRVASGSFAESLCLVKFPGLLAVPLAMVVPGLTMCATAAALHGDGAGDVALGVVALLGTAAAIGLVTVTVVRHFAAVYVLDMEIDPETERKAQPHAVLRFFNGSMTWKSPMPSNYFKKVFTPLFEDYRHEASDNVTCPPRVPLQYFFGVELSLSFVCGMLDGTRPDTFAGCRTAAIVALVVNACWLLFAAMYVPCSSLYRNLFLIGNATLITASLGLAVAAHVTLDEGFATAAAAVAGASMYATLVKAVIDLALLVLDVYRDWRKYKARSRRRGGGVPDRDANGTEQRLLDAVPKALEKTADSLPLAGEAVTMIAAPYEAPLEVAATPQPHPSARLAVLDDSLSSSSGSSTPPPAPDPDAGRRATQRFDYFDVDGLDEVAAEAAPLQDEIDDTRHFTDMRTRNVHRSEEAQQLLDAWLTYDPHKVATTAEVPSRMTEEQRRKQSHSPIDDFI